MNLDKAEPVMTDTPTLDNVIKRIDTFGSDLTMAIEQNDGKEGEEHCSDAEDIAAHSHSVLVDSIRAVFKQRDLLRDLLDEALHELATIEAITVSPTPVDGLMDLIFRMRGALNK